MSHLFRSVNLKQNANQALDCPEKHNFLSLMFLVESVVEFMAPWLVPWRLLKTKGKIAKVMGFIVWPASG